MHYHWAKNFVFLQTTHNTHEQKGKQKRQKKKFIKIHMHITFVVWLHVYIKIRLALATRLLYTKHMKFNSCLCLRTVIVIFHTPQTAKAFLMFFFQLCRSRCFIIHNIRRRCICYSFFTHTHSGTKQNFKTLNTEHYSHTRTHAYTNTFFLVVSLVVIVFFLHLFLAVNVYVFSVFCM